jgi:hypothetical protein
MTEVGLGGRNAGSIERWSDTAVALLHPTHITHGMSACTTLLHHFSFYKRNSLLSLFIYFLPFYSFLSSLTSLVSLLDASNQTSETSELQSASLSIERLVAAVLLCIEWERVRACVCVCDIKRHEKKSIIVIRWRKHSWLCVAFSVELLIQNWLWDTRPLFICGRGWWAASKNVSLVIIYILILHFL